MSYTGFPPNVSYRRAAAISVRRVNDEILKTATRFDDSEGSMFEFLCECGDLRCHRYVAMTLAEYRATTPGSVLAHD